MRDECTATTPAILGFDHIQLTMPRDAEPTARQFYGETLGLPELAKPAALAARGGVWFRCGDCELHLGVEDDFRPQCKWHPALRVDDLAALRTRLEAAGAPIAEDVPLPGRLRFETRDPFGNRLEFQQLLAAEDALEDAAEREAHERVWQTFAPNAEAYVASESHAGGADLERLVELAAPRATDSALDVSTGGGHVALALAPHVARMVASDLTPRMLAAARAHISAQGATNVDYVIADAERLPFLDESFDLVTVRIAPHHYANVATAVREMARVLAPGGRLLLVDNIAPEDTTLDALLNHWEKWRDPSHVRNYTVGEWRAYLTDAGLAISDAEAQRKTHDFAPWVERMRMPPAESAKLEAEMLAAPPEAQEYFEIAASDGHVVHWSFESLIVRAVKPAAE